MDGQNKILANLINLYFIYIADHYQDIPDLNSVLKKILPNRDIDFYKNDRNYIDFMESALITETLIRLTKNPNLPYDVGLANFKYLDKNFAFFAFIKHFATSKQILEKVCEGTNIGNGYLDVKLLSATDYEGEFSFEFKNQLIDIKDPFVERHCNEIILNLKGILEAISLFRFGKIGIVKIERESENINFFKVKIINQHNKFQLLFDFIKKFAVLNAIVVPLFFYFNIQKYLILSLALPFTYYFFKKFHYLSNYTKKSKREEIEYIITENNLKEKSQDEFNNIKLSSKLNQIESLDTLVNVAAREIVQNYNLERGVIILVNFENNRLKINASFPSNSIADQLINKFDLPLYIESKDKNKLSNIILNKNKTIIQDLDAHIETLEDQESKAILQALGSKSLVIIPLVSSNTVYGAFLTDTARKNMSPDILARLEGPCNHLAASLRRVYLSNKSQLFVPNKALKLIGVNDIVHVNSGKKSELKIGIFFSDIIGFTKLTEEINDNNQVMKYLNDYFSSTHSAFSENNGYIDNYMGDAIFGVFPTLENLINGGIDFKIRLLRLNSKRTANSQTLMETRIGLAFGDVILGLVGSQGRMLVTGTGDTINVGAKVEAIGKELGSGFTVTSNVAENIPLNNNIKIRSLGKHYIGGKEKQTQLFEVLVNPKITNIENCSFIDKQVSIFNKKIKALDKYNSIFNYLDKDEDSRAWNIFKLNYNLLKDEPAIRYSLRKKLSINFDNFSNYLTSLLFTKNINYFELILEDKLKYILTEKEKEIFIQKINCDRKAS